MTLLGQGYHSMQGLYILRKEIGTVNTCHLQDCTYAISGNWCWALLPLDNKDNTFGYTTQFQAQPDFTGHINHAGPPTSGQLVILA